MIENSHRITHNMHVAVGFGIGRNIGWLVSACIVGDAAVALAELAQLALPAPMVACKLVNEEDRRAMPYFLVVKLHIVRRRCVRHQNKSRYSFCSQGVTSGRSVASF